MGPRSRTLVGKKKNARSGKEPIIQTPREECAGSPRGRVIYSSVKELTRQVGKVK